MELRDLFTKFLLFLSIAVIPLFNGYAWISTTLILPGLAVASFFGRGKINSGHLLLNPFFRVFVGLLFIGLLSAFFVISPERYLAQNKRLFGVVTVIIVTIFLLNRDPKNFRYFQAVYIVKFVLLVSYSYFFGLFENLDLENDRLYADDVAGINANSFGYFAFFALFFASLLYLNTRRRVYLILYILLFASSLYVNVLAASRGGLLFTILSLLLFILILYLNSLRSLFILSVFLILFLYTIFTFASSFDNLYVVQRFLSFTESGEDERLDIFGYGLQLLMKSPMGVGAGQFPLFVYQKTNTLAVAHNSFIESGVEFGWLGLLLYLSLFVRYTSDSVRLIGTSVLFYKQLFLLFSSFLVLFFLYNFFYDMILDLYIMQAFFLVFMYQRKISTSL